MLLQVKNISVHYGKIKAIKRLSLEIKKGEIVALIGANGAGKTTTLKTISGLLRPSYGEVLFDGEDISKLKPHMIVQRGISHVPERRGIFSNLTVYENLLMGAYTRKVTASDFDEIYDLFPRLKERRKQIGGTLSGGEQQMLAISRALLCKPKLILLDEPSLGLAPQLVKGIMDKIKTINASGTTVLLVEQNAHVALKTAHRGYCLEVGEVFCTDSCERLLKNETIKEAYLGETH